MTRRSWSRPATKLSGKRRAQMESQQTAGPKQSRIVRMLCQDCGTITPHYWGKRPEVDGCVLLLAGDGPHCVECLKDVVAFARSNPKEFAALTGFREIKRSTDSETYNRVVGAVWPGVKR